MDDAPDETGLVAFLQLPYKPILLMGVAIPSRPVETVSAIFSIQLEFDVTFRGMRADP